MKTLILVRHAKSSWEFDVTDHERPLKKRGINDAKLVSETLKHENFKFDKILSSDATRTKETSKIFLKHLNINGSNIEYLYKLYDFAGADLTDVIKNTSKKVNNLLVFGHNHAITAFVNTFGSAYVDNVPTSGVVIINFDVDDWNLINEGETIKTIFPKHLKD
ncbi:histidine phosphatase family protein [Seonamhaeicola algicola]|uniref:Histidine phosphatase family protein n=1 Tax=Seonamhaeicola algicola TaxID=1719036 RepID=A0A5C7AS06_9FLAO|nr:histidine phosphatase family protein [Seonamhaeicola algicola]TXE11518.1 histidine phosphatase family protein [Seonamhaeicola algicola]